MHLQDWRVPLLLILWLFGFQPATAQLPLPTVPVYAHFHSSNSSLPAELIYKIHADHNGYLWLVTDRGLVRYNGREFRLIKTGPAEDFVSSCMAENNRLWLFGYSGHTAGIDLNTQKIIATDSLYGLNKLPSTGRLFLMGIHQDSLLSLYDQNRKRVVRVRLDTRQSWSMPQSRFETAEELFQKYRFPSVWKQQLLPELATILRQNCYGLSVKDGFITIGSRIFKTAPDKEAVLYFNGADYGIHTVIMGFARSNNDLYLGGLHEIGLCRIRGYFSSPRSAQVIEHLLPQESITSVEKDYLNNIWAGSHGNGLFFFPNSEINTLHYNKSYSGLYSDKISYIGRFPGDITVLGYHNAITDFYTSNQPDPRRYTLPAGEDIREISHVERTAFRWLVFTRNEAYFAGFAKSLLPDHFKRAVIDGAGTAPGYKSGRQVGKILYYITSNAMVTFDLSGHISRYAAKKSTLPKKTCLLPLSDTDFYIGTVQGCYRNDKHLPYLQDAQITAVDTVGGKLLWATNTGVYAIPLSSAEDRRNLRKLISTPCTGLQHDSAFTYLRCTDELIVIDNSSLRTIARFSSRDYVQSFRLSSFYTDRDYLVLAGNQGLYYIPKQSLLSQAPQPRMHVLCSLNGYTPSDSVYTCTYRKGLTALFELDVLDYKKEKKMISCRILKDGEELYRERDLKEDGAVALNPTTPGHYEIVYRIRSGYAGNDRVLTYRLEVKPRWYQQWWCIPLLIILIGLLLAWILYRILDKRVKRQRRQLEQKIHLHELEAKSLLGQLKPHFIFNALTPIQGFLMRSEKLEGLDYLDHFSGLMRGMLQGIRHRYVPLTEEITFISQYLQVQQGRYQHCFVYNIRIDPALNPGICFIPSLLLQPLVENAVEHGIVKGRKDGKIDINFEAQDDTVRITITDNGRGLPPDWKLKPDHALAIIKERIELLKQTKGTGFFQLANNGETGEGTTAVIILAKDNRL